MHSIKSFRFQIVFFHITAEKEINIDAQKEKLKGKRIYIKK